MCSFLVVASCSFITLGNKFLNMCTGIILLLLPVSILYGTVILLWPTDIFKLVVNTEWFLLKWTKFILTTSVSSPALSWNVSCSTSLTALVLFSYFSEVGNLASLHACLPIHWVLFQCMLPPYLHICLNDMLDYVSLLGLSLQACLATQIWSNSLISVMVLITPAQTLCSSILFTNINTFSLVTV